MDIYSKIREFYDFLETNPLTSGQIALWQALLYTNNKARWAEWFTVASQTLSIRTGLSRKGINAARNTLKQKGLIDFKTNGNNATQYALLCPVDMATGRSEGMSIDMSTGMATGRSEGMSIGTINKTKNKTKTGEEDKSRRRSAGAREEVLPPRAEPPSDRDRRTLISTRVWIKRQSGGLFEGQEAQLEQLLNSDRFRPEIIWEALSSTERRNSRYGELDDPMGYAMSLLFDWEEKGIKNVAELAAFRTLGRVEQDPPTEEQI